MMIIVSCILSIILFLQNFSFAVIDQAKLFISSDFINDGDAAEALKYSIECYRKLGYDIQNSFNVLPYTVTDQRDTVLNYIRGTGKNYAILISSHGNYEIITMRRNDLNQYIYPFDITGAWHFVFLDSCYSMANDSFAQAFRTVGYSNRATLGWYKSVETPATAIWWKNFKNVVGTTDLRTACLAAADCAAEEGNYSTPKSLYIKIELMI